MELDVFVPSLSLAFEYQGYHHYHQHGMFHAPEFYQEQDETKRKQCIAHNITLIAVPYWWNHDPLALAATIRARRADVLLAVEIPPDVAPISEMPRPETKAKNLEHSLQSPS